VLSGMVATSNTAILGITVCPVSDTPGHNCVPSVEQVWDGRLQVTATSKGEHSDLTRCN
jgi:hypothetical protein